MAKRGYRGNHPHNDMKVSKNPSSDKYSQKLTTEYNKLKSKKAKYDYIRTHYFYPQASFTLSSSLDLAHGSNKSEITMSTVDGTIFSFEGGTADNTGNKVFKANGTAEQASNGIVKVINANLGAGSGNKVTASVSNEVVTVTQTEPGPDGNTTLTLKNVDELVTINGVTAKNSGSGLGFING